MLLSEPKVTVTSNSPATRFNGRTRRNPMIILLPIFNLIISFMASVPQSISIGLENSTSLSLPAFITKGMNGLKKVNNLKIFLGTTCTAHGTAQFSSVCPLQLLSMPSPHTSFSPGFIDESLSLQSKPVLLSTYPSGASQATVALSGLPYVSLSASW